jgi:hypothetical protein
MTSNVNEDELDPRLARLDVSGIRFPSDKLSISDMRMAHPELFDVGFAMGDDAQPRFFLQGDAVHHAGDSVGDMLYWERILALCVFASISGCRPPPLIEIDQKTIKDELASLYVRYGIAEGAHHASEMLRDVEDQIGHFAKTRSA